MTAIQPTPASTHCRPILPLQIEQLCYQHKGKALVHDIDITLQQQGISIILGANGAGKTLLLQLLSGLLPISSGRLCWHSAPNPRDQTMVFQQPVLLQRSVLANVEYALAPLPRRERRQRARQALAWAGCEALAELFAPRLSTGQRQLVALARARAQQPQLLLLDEPCANLDPNTSLQVENLIRDLQEQDCKILMSTHNLAQAKRLADDILFMDKGLLCEYSPAELFFQQPQSLQAQDFLALEYQ